MCSVVLPHYISLQLHSREQTRCNTAVNWLRKGRHSRQRVGSDRMGAFPESGSPHLQDGRVGTGFASGQPHTTLSPERNRRKLESISLVLPLRFRGLLSPLGQGHSQARVSRDRVASSVPLAGPGLGQGFASRTACLVCKPRPPSQPRRPCS